MTRPYRFILDDDWRITVYADDRDEAVERASRWGRLLAEVETDDFERVDGGALCGCGRPFRDHPTEPGREWLTRSCGGLVKL